MPRAENRKRPPNMSGGAWDVGVRNKTYGVENASESQGTQSKKQELLEKMRKLQENKKAEPKS